MFMEPSRSTITVLEVLGALSEHVEPQYASAWRGGWAFRELRRTEYLLRS
ncbi:transcriptional regulator [Cutibacterium acnes JCM 18920]|nr:transcriptional regulator [Cutibacterium acnes JCM 18920]